MAVSNAELAPGSFNPEVIFKGITNYQQNKIYLQQYLPDETVVITSGPLVKNRRTRSAQALPPGGQTLSQACAKQPGIAFSGLAGRETLFAVFFPSNNASV